MGRKAEELIPPGLLQIADNIISKDNILGASKKNAARWAKDLSLAKEASTIFFAGCGYQYSSGLQSLLTLVRKMDKGVGVELTAGLAGLGRKMGLDLAGIYRNLVLKGDESDGLPLKDAVKVLEKLGINFGYLGEDEPCCGGPLYFFGLEKEFRDHALKVGKKLKSLGVKKIIGIVPSCTYTLREIIPRYFEGFDIEVRHFVEVVAERMEPGKYEFPKKVKVVYHDPCQLSRYLGLTSEPRQILKSIKGIELLEPEWSYSEWSTCCGGGGGFEAVFPQLSQILAVSRVQELLSTGAEAIITHCPGCIIQLKEGLKEVGKSEVEVYDLAQVVAMAMEV